MRWPWPWPNDLDTWAGHGQDVPPYQKWSFCVNYFKSHNLNRHTTMLIRKHYIFRIRGGKNISLLSWDGLRGMFYWKYHSRQIWHPWKRTYLILKKPKLFICRSVQMRLYTLNKRQFVLVFVTFFICFGLSILIGLGGKCKTNR